MKFVLITTLTCPSCLKTMEVVMPVQSTQLIYECEHCYALIKGKEGDCCVFCSHGSIKCPKTQFSMQGPPDEKTVL